MIIIPGTIVYDELKHEYKVLNLLGAGNFGTVYKIKEKSKRNVLALKALQMSFKDEMILKSFVNEGKLAIQVVHNNVISYRYFHDGSQYPSLPPYIIMDYASGGTLLQLIDSKRAKNEFFSNDELKTILDQLINGMEAINKVLVHRDIKPDNILIDNDVLKISDFGLSKVITEATRTSTFKGIGCLPYMAPEVWTWEKNTIRMDIYSMGIVFYEVATLQHPLKISNGDVKSWEVAHTFQIPIRPDLINKNLSSILTQIIIKMIEKRADSRFQNWQEIRDFLGKQDLPYTYDSDLVENILKKKLHADEQAKQKQLKIQKREQEIDNQRKLVQFQLQKDIIIPLQDFIYEINAKYSGPKNAIETTISKLGFRIMTSALKTITCSIELVLKENFYRERVLNDYGANTRKTVLELPNYRGIPLLAWGFITAQDGCGLNLLLLENEGQPYGSWIMLINRPSALTGGNTGRSTPFAFDFNEIEHELNHVGALHIYVSEGKTLDMQDVKKFVSNYI